MTLSTKIKGEGVGNRATVDFRQMSLREAQTINDHWLGCKKPCQCSASNTSWDDWYQAKLIITAATISHESRCHELDNTDRRAVAIKKLASNVTLKRLRSLETGRTQ